MAESARNANDERSAVRRTRVLTSVDPRTGESVGDYAVMGQVELARTVRTA